MKAGEIFWDVVPYVTLAIVVVGTWWRYRYDKFGWTTRSSQLYESRLLRIGSPMFHFGMLVVVFGHVIGLVIPQSWTDAVGLSHHAYHVQAVILGSIAGITTLAGISLLIYRRRTTGPVFMATTANDKLMYVVLVLAIVAGLCATALGSGVVGEAYNYRETVSVWFRSIWILQPRGDLMAAGAHVFPGARDDRAGAVLPVAVHPVGARVQRTDRLSVPALCRLPQPRRRGQGPSGGVDAAAPGLVTTSSLRRESAVGDARQARRIHTVSATSVDLEVVMPSGYPYSKSVRPELFDRVCGGAPPRRAAQDPHGPR